MAHNHAPDDLQRRAAAGAWLRQTRERRGFATLNEFARALRIDPSRVSNYELGKSAVPDGRAARIAEVLDMSELDVRRGLGLWVPDEDPGDAGGDAGVSELNPFVDPQERRIWQMSGFSEEERWAMVTGLRVSRDKERIDAQDAQGPRGGEEPG